MACKSKMKACCLRAARALASALLVGIGLIGLLYFSLSAKVVGGWGVKKTHLRHIGQRRPLLPPNPFYNLNSQSHARR